MKVLITGKHGQLARSLVERGADRGSAIVTVGRPEADLAVPATVSAAIEAVRPDLVINAAAYTNVDDAEDEPSLAFRINAEAAGEIAAAAARVGAPVIQISTDYVFGDDRTTPYTEDSPPRPLGIYGKSKLAGEERVRAANPRHMIVRTAWLFSPFGRNFVTAVMEAAATRDRLTVVNDQIGSPTSALDLADGLLRAADMIAGGWDRGFGETFHLAGTGSSTRFELAEFVMAECRSHSLDAAEVVPIRTADWPTKARRPANSTLDSSKFSREFSFSMPPWRDSVSAVVQRLSRAPA